MGYNNHHAGMHMIWFPRHFEDWSFDRSIEEQWRVKSINEKEARKEETQVDIPDIEDGAPAVRKKRKDRSMQKHNNKYGTEFVINGEFFYDTDLVTRNIIYTALKNKKDLFTILKETDELMETDARMNPDPKSEWYGFPLLNKAIVYMQILADKLDCNYREFFLDNSDLIRKFLYKMLDDISLESWNGDVDEEGNAEFFIFQFDKRFLGINSVSGLNELHVMNKYGTMDLVIDKEYYGESAHYSLSYGNLTIKQRKNNIIWGAYLLEEDRGKLRDLVEKLIEMNTDLAD